MSALLDGGSTRRWRRLRLAVLTRDAWRCQVPINDRGEIDPAGRACLLPADTVDHLVPRALGGDDSEANLRAACTPHNLRKGGRLDGAARGRAGPRRRDPRARSWEW